MRTHLVTGAGSGIGTAIADLLHTRGDRLVLVARSAHRGAELVARWPGSLLVIADLADPSVTVETMTATELPDALDSVVHSAGIGEMAPIAEADAQLWTRVLSVNLTAPALLTAACLPALRRSGGTVVFINSGAGLSSGPGWAPYSASKFGLKALADSLRAEEQAHGVRVTTVYPGRTATPMQAALHAHEGNPYDPTRWIQPETVAATVLQVLDLAPDATIADITVRPR
jgi:NAD(P)-dependent dehydrogenase (short-subunit alcohol dehydrogenase family)